MMALLRLFDVRKVVAAYLAVFCLLWLKRLLLAYCVNDSVMQLFRSFSISIIVWLVMYMLGCWNKNNLFE